MTPAEELAVVRARLEQMIGLCEGDHAYRARIGVSWETDYSPSVADDEEDHYLAAASPDLLLRVAREALSVLDRHHQHQINCGNVVFWPIVRFCPEVKAILRAWQP